MVSTVLASFRLLHALFSHLSVSPPRRSLVLVQDVSIGTLSWFNFLSSSIVSIGIPIAILLTNDDPIVKENAKESLNFHINLYIYALIFALLILIAIGIVLLIVLGIVSFIMPIIAIIKVIDAPNQPYRYPFIFRLF